MIRAIDTLFQFYRFEMMKIEREVIDIVSIRHKELLLIKTQNKGEGERTKPVSQHGLLLWPP